MVNEAFSFLPPLSLHLFLSLPSFLSPNLPIFLLSHLPRPVCSIEQPALGHRPRSSGVTCRCVLTTCSQRKGFPGRGNSVGMGQDGSSGTTEGGASVQVEGVRVELRVCDSVAVFPTCTPHVGMVCTGHQVQSWSGQNPALFSVGA